MADRTHTSSFGLQHNPASTHETVKRVRWLKLVLLLAFAAVVARLLQIQVFESAKYQEIARKQYQAKVRLLANRGNIYDRNGKVLASNAIAISYAADPTFVGQDAAAIAGRLASVFGESKKAYYLSRLTTSNKRFEWLERKASPQTLSLIQPERFNGLIQVHEPLRIYHDDHVAGQLLGFTDVDNNALSGIELQFDTYLRGKDGYMIMQRDGLGRKRPMADLPRVEPVNGNSIVLTIDLDCQAIAEEELRKGVERNQAEGGVVVMLDPNTGDVLAMACYPSMNPARYNVADSATRRNRIVTDVFEPGSLFKIVTASAALEYRLVSPDQKFYAENGTYKVKGRPEPITDVRSHGYLTLREAVEVSSNIVMAKISNLVGPERLYITARNFGFGTRTGIELPGEATGILKKPNQWSGTTLNSLAFGYEVNATPLQLAAAYAAIANGGVLMKPRIIKRIINDRNEVLVESRPEKIRRVISRATADSVRSFLRGVVEHGTAANTNTMVVPIAGKTGTARQTVGMKHSHEFYTAFFVGMFPAEEPRIVCLVLLDKPRALGYYGAYTSAPIVKAIAEKVTATSSAMARMQPSARIADAEWVATPDVRTLPVEAAKAILSSFELEVKTHGEGAVVAQQTPAPGAKISRGATVLLTTETVPKTTAGYTVVPDVRGLSLRRALNRLTLARLGAYVDGSGLVVAQSLAAGQRVEVGTRIGLRCESKRHSALTSL